MNTIPQHFIASQKNSLSCFLAVQGAMLEGFEKLVDLNLKVLKSSFDDVSVKSQQAAQAQDAQEAYAFSAALLEPNTDKALAYGKDCYNVVAEVQSQLKQLSQAQLTEFQKQMTEAIEQFGSQAPAGTEGMVALIKSTLATLNTAYEAVANSAHQASEVAQSNIAAGTAAGFKAATEAAQGSTAGASRARRASA